MAANTDIAQRDDEVRQQQHNDGTTSSDSSSPPTWHSTSSQSSAKAHKDGTGARSEVRTRDGLPLLIKKRRLEEMIEDTRDEVRRLEAILDDYFQRNKRSGII